ncbi:hypothetical protein GOB94_15145 [Granulicella sp. 5B5]|uniref:hypothetical protein n=1 Tax=Granulicella sp. 5B5 TaxID=1617967 RepID=UPI0015F594A8|nr:hypothetical protein [Granulicella sp. 5B5]QMV19869.1 hypothetical protein GOB94_15145 [Granulicella sp. 5B5]
MSSGSFTAALFLSSSNPPASLIPSQITGNVGVCLSGGGSRAFTAGMGQLQALEALQANGASLLSQVVALSTVSGGGWIGIPFTYLPSSQGTDATFLGLYTEPASLSLDIIHATPSGIGQQINSGFSISEIALTAIHLATAEGVPWNMVWQTIMGLTFLQPYDLFSPGTDDAPTDLFSYNTASLTQYVTGPNPSLDSTMTDLVAQPTGQRRPYLISLCGLSVSVNGVHGLLAPVQSTPIATGVLSTPPGATDINQRPVGSGGVASFAFNSTPTASSSGTVTVQQSRQWSLTDILGTSSAAFAQDIINKFNEWKLNPVQFQAELRVHSPAVLSKLTKAGMVHNPAGLLSAPGGPATIATLPSAVQDIIPVYDYWSPLNPPIGQTLNPNQFTDGGSLENTGVASMLSYSNVTRIVAFINTEHPLAQATGGPVQVDGSLPPLFGYQPYSNGAYTPYGNGEPIGKGFAPFQFNQVFPSDAFADLQQGLWSASGSGQHSAAAIYTQQLTTVANPWFGVPGGQSVTVVWVYLNYDTAWYDAITDPFVRVAVDFDVATHHFPSYSTLKTDLSATQVNLLSNFASWIVQSNAATFIALFS